MTVKQQVQKILDELPDDCSIEDLQYRLYVIDVIRNRLEEEKRGGFVSQEEVEQRFAQWAEKRGLSG
jgi:predicted transcriptional regulator